MRTENQDKKNPSKQPNPILSMEEKTKINQKSFSMQMKIVLLD
jgi:hypothetical protein